ncbi:hypothetical protein IKS57_06165 [bacterium]|nr:hypothetical protein [bacterium]
MEVLMQFQEKIINQFNELFNTKINNLIIHTKNERQDFIQKYDEKDEIIEEKNLETKKVENVFD